MSKDATARLDLPCLVAGQMQKHVTLNEALTRLDALVQTAVESRTTIDQPSSPTDGALYILPAGAAGSVWGEGEAGSLMRADAGGWARIAAPDGLVALVRDSGELFVRHAGQWTPLGRRLGEAQGLRRLGLGGDADGGTPFLAKLNAALWTARETSDGGDGDLRLTLNKQSGGDVLSLLFQTGFSARAELGLVGDDDLRLKVSPDGGTFHEAFSVDRSTGRMRFPAGAARCELTRFVEGGRYTPPAWAAWIEVIAVGGGAGGAPGGFGSSGDRPGGRGGAAGQVARATWSVDALGGQSLTVVVGAGGAAGADGGASGVARGATVLLVGPGGAGAGGVGLADSSGDGGRGGGLSASGANPAAEAGRPGAPGGVRAEGGAPGTAGAAAPLPDLHWAGGGGGGGLASTTGPGGPGGRGNSAGGGGGGGGAGLTTGGSGGAGAAGTVWLRAFG